jgi:bifunctional non-homologous end joining protein LigD
MKMQVGGRTIELSNPEKKLYPQDGLSKKDIADYYRKISGWLLYHVKDRILTMERYPDGIEEEGFVQQKADNFDAVKRQNVPRKDGSELTRILCNNSACLVSLANLGAVTLHMWLSRVDAPEYADRMIFDLDPDEDDFGPVRRGALLLRELLDEIGLRPFVMTTGSKGAHVVVPLKREKTFDEVRRFAGDVASLLARRHSDELTTEQRRIKRRERLYIDVMRNGYGQTGVVPYSLRPVGGAAVAAPLDWREVETFCGTARKYTCNNIFRRLGHKEDPWKNIGRYARSLKNPAEKLAALRRKY